ncbi:MAG: hypothetical protein QM756_43320 [Polyangiaceae bacterium]
MMAPMFRVPIAALSLAACMAGPALAELRQYCDVVYDLPPGWVLHNDGEGYQHLRPRNRDMCKGCSLYITGGMTARAARAVLSRGGFGQFLSEDDPAPEQIGEPGTMRAGQTALTIGGWKLGEDLLFVAAVEIGEQAAVIGFRGAGGTPEALTATGDTFQETITHLANTLYHTPAGGPPVMPAAQAGPLDGIYWGSVTRSSLGLDGMMKMDIDSRVFVFWPEGFFYDGEPEEGLALPDLSAFTCPDETNADWGTYRTRGKEVTVTYLTGDTETMRLSSESLYDGDRQMFRADPVEDDERIEGVISRFSYSAFDPNIISGGASSSSYVAYRKDGTYVTSSSQGVAGSIQGIGVDAGTVGGVASSSESNGGGTYRIADSALHMAPADGSAPLSRLIYRLGDDIFIGTEPLKTD